MNFPRLTLDDVMAIRLALLAFAAQAEAFGNKRDAKKYRMLAERLMEIA